MALTPVADQPGGALVEQHGQHDGERDQERRADVVDGDRPGSPLRAPPPSSQDGQRDPGRRDGDQEEEDPPPAHEIDEDSADRRPEQEARVKGHRHVSARPPLRALGHGLDRQHARGRGDHGRADALHGPGQDEGKHVWREAAEQRARRHDGKSAAVDRVSPVDVAEPPEHDRQADAGELVGDERPRDADDVGVERGRDRRQRHDEDPRGKAGEELPHDRVGEEEDVGPLHCASAYWPGSARETTSPFVS